MRKLRITIENKSYDVTVEDLTEMDSYRPAAAPLQPPTPPAAPAASPAPVPSTTAPQSPGSSDSGAVTSPMAGVIRSIQVKKGDQVKAGQPLIILEAMKMENQIAAPVAGTVRTIAVAIGDSVPEGHVLLVLE